MAEIKVKGHTIQTIAIKDSFSRRAQRFKTIIIQSLKEIGLTDDDVYIELEPVAIKKAPATAVWYLEGQRLQCDYNGCPKYVENLYVVSKIIECEIQQVLSEEKTIDEFIRDFVESYDVNEERKAARELLDVSEDETDLNIINKKYKTLAKNLHPDMESGDLEKFKALNHAHKVLKRELA
ncbi:MAG: J domain-containing protein [Candidatus Woesearchaeota archaeon]